MSFTPLGLDMAYQGLTHLLKSKDRSFVQPTPNLQRCSFHSESKVCIAQTEFWGAGQRFLYKAMNVFSGSNFIVHYPCGL